MKINWKLRFANPLWWWRVLMAVIVPIISYFGLTVENLDSWAILGQTLIKSILNPYVLGLVIVSVWNTIADPTARGLGDSESTLCCILPQKPNKKTRKQ